MFLLGVTCGVMAGLASGLIAGWMICYRETLKDFAIIAERRPGGYEVAARKKIEDLKSAIKNLEIYHGEVDDRSARREGRYIAALIRAGEAREASAISGLRIKN